MQFPDVTKAFTEVRTYLAAASKPQGPVAPLLPSPPRPLPAAVVSGDDDSSEGRLENWVSLSIQQDLVFHSKTADACSPGSRYEVLTLWGNERSFCPMKSTRGEIKISDRARCLARCGILVGYERVVHPNVTVAASKVGP